MRNSSCNDLNKDLWVDRHFISSCLLVLGCLLLPVALSASEASEVRNLAARADALMRLGVAEMGASRAFDDATELLGQAEDQLGRAELPSATETALTLEIEAVREDLDHLVGLYEDRFYGVFPLARLTVPTLLADEGLALTEQVFNSPDVAAVIIATRRVADLLDEYHHPSILFRSSPANRLLENVASEELLRDGRSTPYNRKTLVNALGAEQLSAFDRGDLGSEVIGQLAQALDAVSLLILTIGQSVELEDAQVRTIQGDYFQPGEVVQGSSVDATPWVRLESFDVVGSARDRRDQYPLIVFVQLILLALALIWSAQVKWSLGGSSKVFGRLAIGAVLFVFGRLFALVLIFTLRRFMPQASALAAAAWWWPALLGVMIILGGGLIAWIGQARLTNIMPGRRGARAVGTIFALVAMGASSHFVAPLLIFDPSAGFANLLPFLLATLSLALLFAFAARTGPPVPHYFTVGPLLVAPLVGMSLLRASPGRLWLTVALGAVLCLAAWVRHRVAVARGTEEPEPDPDKAAEEDEEKLMKLDSKIPKKL